MWSGINDVSFMLQRTAFSSTEFSFLKTRKKSMVHRNIHSLTTVSVTLTFDSMTLKTSTVPNISICAI